MKIPTEGPFRYAGTHMLCSVQSIIVKLSYTDAKVYPQIAKVSNVFQKCAKAGHVWCNKCQCEFSYSSNLSNSSMNGVDRSL